MATALVAAAGTGERLGTGEPKALVDVAGRPLAVWCIQALAGAASVERIVVASPPEYENALAKLLEGVVATPVEVVPGSDSRSLSVANALAAAGGASVVVVHDAARPLVTAELVDRCVAELERSGADGAIAATRTTDTIKEADSGGHVIATLERSNLWAVQTPQAFRADALRDALAAGPADRAYDDAQLVESAGGDVRIVEAPRENLKVTTPIDLRLAEQLLAERGVAG